MEQREDGGITIPAGGAVEISLKIYIKGRMAWLMVWMLKHKWVRLDPTMEQQSGPGGLEFKVGEIPQSEYPPEYGPVPPHRGSLN